MSAKARKALVIVESPAKCRTIEKILGKRFKVEASMGHIIDLPKSKMGVDVENDFKPQYIVMVKKRKTLTNLKKLMKTRQELYLACDPDREGEAISWHLGNELGKEKSVYRVSFQEITPQAVEEAFQHPKEIDMKKVGAQQARRILDRLVGYSLSPILWKAVAKGLSAGRVQSVALRLIVDQERKIKAFVPDEYWSLDANLKKIGDHEKFTASLDQAHGKKIEIKTKDDAHRIAEEVRQAEFKVAQVKISQRRRKPQPPYTTSKLQQEAYNRLHMRPTRAMAVAQSLYEGVDLGHGETVGLITYMRTDSVAIAKSAMDAVRAFIPKHYGSEYLPKQPNRYRTKKGAQAAHEAIRPTGVTRTPESVAEWLTEDQLKLYALIWSKFVASQMNPAVYQQTSAEIAAGAYLFKASGSRLLEAGFLKAFEDEDALKTTPLPHLEKDEPLELLELEENQHFTKPPPRFTDASLVKTLEELGIGRPSTYAPIIQTIVQRTYVERQAGALVPTELGFLVVDLLVKHFPKLMDVDFTANMEERLDEVEEGKVEWHHVLKEFYGQFAKSLEEAQASIKPVRKLEEKTDEVCELCKRPMVIKWGRRGKFLSCSGFPECRNAKSIPTKISCPQCKEGLLVQRKARSGRGRLFYGCTRYPECTFIANKLPSSEEQQK